MIREEEEGKKKEKSKRKEKQSIMVKKSLVKCRRKKKSDDYGGQIKYYEADGTMVKKKKKNVNVGKMLKSTRFMLQRCSNSMKNNKVLKRKKSFSSISTTTTYTEEVSSDDERRTRKRKQQKQKHESFEDELNNNIIEVKRGGDTIDIMPLLFPKHRPYLLKSNSTQLVKAEDLQGKIIALCFASLDDSLWEDLSFCLIDIYHQIHQKAQFEVVFVPLTLPEDHPAPHFDPHHAFTSIFSCMPWTAVPYSDFISRQRLQATFGFSGSVYPNVPVIDPTGLILAVQGQRLFSTFGSEGYPYTDQRLQFLRAEERALLQHPSIYNLLTSSEREYVISNDGRQVPILSLEDKVVALHFVEDNYRDAYQSGSYVKLTERLMTTYEKLRDKNFEVVLVYIHDSWNTLGSTNVDTFWKTFKTMPWLAIPFKDPVIKKLRRICSYPLDLDGPGPDPRLVIVGPRGEFFEPYGADILMNFGIQAYPFNRRRMVQLEAEKAKKVKPAMIWDPDTYFLQNSETEIPFSQVVGKRIILLIGNWLPHEPETESLTLLKSEYIRRKGTDEEFEVIQIFYPEVLSGDDLEHVRVPWLAHFLDEGSPHIKLLHDTFGSAEIVAFDQHGHYVRKSYILYFRGGDESEFPFFSSWDQEDPKSALYASGLEKEIYSDLYGRFGWGYWSKDDICPF